MIENVLQVIYSIRASDVIAGPLSCGTFACRRTNRGSSAIALRGFFFYKNLDNYQPK